MEAVQLMTLTANKYKNMMIQNQWEAPSPHDATILTEVWHMAQFWVSYGRCTMYGSPMGRSDRALSKKHQEKSTIACF